MIRWLLSLFGFKKDHAASPPPTPSGPPPSARRREVRPGASANEPGTTPGPEAPPERVEFLVQLVSEHKPVDLQTLGTDDRIFRSGILKRIRENQLSIPLLPRAALEISRLLGNPNTHIDEFVRVLESDPALSVDLLRIANSAFYGFSGATQSVHHAVVRIGLTQIRGLIIVAHLHGRVLQGGVFQSEAGQISRLSMALAQLGQELSASLGLDANAAFTRGVLSHVEHFVIMGTLAEISKEQQRRILPTTVGLLEAAVRFGPRVRALAASAWGLEGLMKPDESSPEGEGVYAQMVRALVAHWSGEPVVGTITGLEPERFVAALRRLSAAGTPHGAAA